MTFPVETIVSAVVGLGALIVGVLAHDPEVRTVGLSVLATSGFHGAAQNVKGN